MGIPFCRPSLASQRLAVSVCHALASYSIGFLAKRNGGAFIVNHCIIDNPHAIDVPHYRQPARQRKRQLHSVWTATAPPHPQESAVTTTAHRDSQGQALQTEPLTRQCAHHRKCHSTVDLRTGEMGGSVLQAFSCESTLGRFGLSYSCELQHRFLGKTEWRCVCR